MEEANGNPRLGEGNAVPTPIKLESFENITNYGRALLNTPLRLLDRVTARSNDEVELVDVKKQSQHEMKKALSWWDLIWFGMGSVIGSGIFVLTGLEVRNTVGPAVVISYAVSGLSAMLSVFCYTEFAVEIPVAGGSFAYLRIELGEFAAFIASGNIILEYVIGGAAVSRSWTSYFATLCNQSSDKFVIVAHSLAHDYNKLDPIAVFVLAATYTFAVFSTKGSSRLNYIASISHLIILMFIIVAGLSKSNGENYSDFTPFGARGIFQSAAVLFFAYVEGWIGYAILVPVWFVGTFGIWYFVPLAKKPKIWGVPLVPFLPSASIGINIFLLGTLDKASFKRFGVWTAILVVYYLLVGVHASYDIAKAQKEKEKLETKIESKMDEENGVSKNENHT